MAKKRRHFGKIDPLSLDKLLSKSSSDRSLIGTRGFSRIVHCNDPETCQLEYCDNYVTTTKYTLASFLPKSLFEQFRRIANLYFLLCAFLSYTPISPNPPVSSVLPLIVVVSVTMLKEFFEDRNRRKQDIEVNNRMTKVHIGHGNFEQTKWMDLRVGDLVKVEKDEYFPADLILLSSSYDEAICYVETTNLDGETNLKLKQALEVTQGLNEDCLFENFRAIIRCEDPNAKLYSFIGSLDFRGQKHPLSIQQLLLRESKLRNTEYIYGVTVFTGHDTKVIQNSVDPPSKRSKIERRTDVIVFFLFSLLFLLAIIGSVYFGIATNKDLLDDGYTMTRWYLRPDETTIYNDPRKALLAGVLHFLRAVMLYGYLIPISLYVSIELVKVLQTEFINKDIHMYYEEGDKPAQTRTSNLNEELGQVNVILSDKTGTLTCNSMEFVKCSIAGTSYGQVVTSVEQAIARRKGLPLTDEVVKGENGDAVDQMNVRGYNFVDDRITNGNWVKEQRSDVIQNFFRVMAICHTVIPVMEEETGSLSYEAESPDDAALVIAARELGFEFYERTHSTISIRELDPFSSVKVERTFELLSIIEFSSSRKRMSVIVKNEEGKLLLLCKGADSVMFERLASNGREFERQTREHVMLTAEAGLRTLILACRVVSEDEYMTFNEAYTLAKSSLGDEHDKLVEEAAEVIEKNLILLGATAVEDKLQQGVPECIEKLAQAGIKLWVLTGDKIETAINVGYACSLLREGMRKIVINFESIQAKASEVSKKSATQKVYKSRILQDLREAKELLYLSYGSAEALALIIDGRSLSYALEEDIKHSFLELALGCASVICCRSSPKQKALVTKLVKSRRGITTLAIGDGGNDVGMLQEADIGIGISGFEGMQAVMASDIAIAQFRFLERLLLVHGHWFYKRISSMICYFFYKNMVFGFTLFYYEAYTSFSGQPAYNDWYLTLYNMIFTSLPVLALGVLDQDISAESCLKFPQLYQEGSQNIPFSWQRILGWLLNGIFGATTVFCLCITTLENQAFRRDGEVAGFEILGATIYTCVIWVVNVQMALLINYITFIHHISIWGSILFWYIFIMAYGAIDPSISSTAYRVFSEACAPSPFFWVLTLLVLVFTSLPYFIYAALSMEFFSLYHQRLSPT